MAYYMLYSGANDSFSWSASTTTSTQVSIDSYWKQVII